MRGLDGSAADDVSGTLPPYPENVAALTKAYHYIMMDVGERRTGTAGEASVRVAAHLG